MEEACTRPTGVEPALTCHILKGPERNGRKRDPVKPSFKQNDAEPSSTVGQKGTLPAKAIEPDRRHAVAPLTLTVLYRSNSTKARILLQIRHGSFACAQIPAATRAEYASAQPWLSFLEHIRTVELRRIGETSAQNAKDR